MPNYGGIINAAGFTISPPSDWAGGAMSGIGVTSPDSNSFQTQQDQSLSPDAYAEYAKKLGWNTKTGAPMSWGEPGSGTWGGGYTPGGAGGGPAGPGGSVLPAGTQVTTGTQTGVQVPYSNQVINPNDTSQRYAGISIPKLPDQIAQEGALQKEITAGTDALKPFSAHLDAAAAALPGIFNKAQASFDPTKTINTLNSRQTGFDTATNQALTDYRGLNAQTAANEQGILAQEQAQIPMFDTNAQAAANQLVGAETNYVGRYKMGSGTPTSLGSAEQQIMGSGIAKILVPMETAKIAAQFGVYRDSMASALDIANREQTRIGQFDPMIAQQQLQTGQLTANTIQQLQTIAQQMDQQSATQFLTALGMAPEMQQKLLSGQLATQGAMAQFQTGNRYLGLQDVLGAQPTQPQSYSTNMGSYPNQNRYQPAMGPQGQPQGGGGGGGGGSNPGYIPPSQSSDWVWDATNQRWQNKYQKDAQGNPITRPGYANSPDLPGGPNTGSQSNQMYDPASGAYYETGPNATGDPIYA